MLNLLNLLMKFISIVRVTILILITYVCGYSQVKQEWVQRFGTEANQIYEISGMTTDNSGNVFIGGSLKGASLSDYFLIKYNSAGIQQWVSTYTGLIEDRLIDMVIDSEGNICVTGLSENQTGTYDIITIKYNTFGDSLWVKRFNGATAFAMDQPVALTADANNNIYVCGYSFGNTPMTYITIKYNPSGDSLWVARYPMSGTNLPRDITADENGNIFVYGRGTTLIKYDQNGNIIWDRVYPFDAAESNKVLLNDKSGNIYFGAEKFTATFTDFAVVKLNSTGDTLWSRLYNGLGNTLTNHDEISAVSLDNAGNIFLTGKIQAQSSFYFSTIKYNSAGEFQWERNYSNINNGQGGKDIITDNAGNVYVTGGSNDFMTIKYNTNGDSLWAMSYNGPSDLNDFAEVLAMDNAASIFVAGRSRMQQVQGFFELAVVKYSQTITQINTFNESSVFRLHQNYPNPFNPSTNIKFEISNDSYVTLKIFDILGKQITSIFNSSMNIGSYEYKFESDNLPGGIYFYELNVLFENQSYSEVKRMVLLK
ncbi:MAG TPA: hypothetical protein DCY06_03900 [Bacteroidetes bacterium]|nr:hypothetical protein [Bacteroidota bacterium]